MTDRELLELAAKAAGMNLGRYADGWNWSNDGPRGAGVYKIDPNQSPVGNPRFKFLFWNPLTDDGDALRLAVKLGMALTFSNDHRESHAEGPIGVAGYAFERHQDDPHGASRRAIVRAAAEIGKTRSD